MRAELQFIARLQRPRTSRFNRLTVDARVARGPEDQPTVASLDRSVFDIQPIEPELTGRTRPQLR